MQPSPSSPSLPAATDLASAITEEIPAVARPTVLLIEAGAALTADLARALDETARLEPCADVETALARAGGDEICALILVLPRERSGDLFVSLGRLRRSAATRRLPILVVNEGRGRGDRDRAFAEGTSEYLETPLNEGELRARVATLARAGLAERDRDRAQAENETLRARLAELTSRLRAVGELDGDTGLPSRRRLDEFLLSEWRRARRNGSPLSLVLIDLGLADPGDVRLPRLAASLRGVLRRGGDMLAHHGERRLAAVLPEVHPEGAAVVAESLRRAVGGTDPTARATVAVVTLRPQEAAFDRPDALLAQAEQSLARALSRG